MRGGEAKEKGGGMCSFAACALHFGCLLGCVFCRCEELQGISLLVVRQKFV